MSEKGVVTIEEIQARQEEISRQLQAMSTEFTRLAAESIADQARFKLIEQQGERHEAEIRELKDSTRLMQIQFEQVMSKIDTLEMKLFNWLQQSQQDSAKERTTSQKQWMQFLQFVLGGTIVAIVTYVFTRGG
ncbi:hypothetical protein [Paenibacillus brevis]|uniref:DUF1640 domain-containing protein n=1 Tax=Paenibacillus brevis TaxID=2841508 RepID=A0ABS6FQZ7_9BACL|nr:hypothetical protein [Paenibacillus brevis]MBU5672657.1 hypothetical protein [Paenibacillus brevis]